LDSERRQPGAAGRRTPVGVLVLVCLALGSVAVVALALFGPPLPGPNVSGLFYDDELAACSPDETEFRAPEEPPPGPGKWRREPSLPTSFDEIQATTVDGRVFVGTGQVLGANDRTASIDQLFAFDPRRGRYERLPPTPEPLDHSRFVTYGGDLYVVGGYSNGEPTNGLWRYSPDEGRWTELAGMRRARAAHGAAVIGHRLYVVGGASEWLLTDPEAAPTASMEVYDFDTGEWSEAPDMPTARHHLGVAAMGGDLYAVGGRAVGEFSLETVERFDSGSARWETLPRLPQGSGGEAVTAIKGEIYAIAGGDDEDGWVTAATWAFEAKSGEWRRSADVTVPRHGQAAAPINGRIYIFGGSPCHGFGHTDSVESLATSRGL
jgi:N-acetylneuraminic acid mutarotase